MILNMRNLNFMIHKKKNNSNNFQYKTEKTIKNF